MTGENAISLRVGPCANGETYEYNLTIGGERVGKPVFLTGNPTAGQKRHALMIALGLHEGGERVCMVCGKGPVTVSVCDRCCE